MRAFIRVQIGFAALFLSACTISSPGGGGDQIIPSQNGKSSVTFSGAVNKTVQYGTATNTTAYCARYKSGDTSITLSEKGENRKNHGWMLDGISFNFYKSLRPQDITEIKPDDSVQMTAVVKEFPEGGTFQISKACLFGARETSQNKLYVSFKCERMTSGKRELTVVGWIECPVTIQNF